MQDFFPSTLYNCCLPPSKIQDWFSHHNHGWHYKKGCTTYKSESHFIQNIVEEISNANWTQLYVAEYPVGINYHAKVIKSLLDIGSDEFCMVGIHGLPRVGKTTIAKVVYRENLGTNAGLIILQEQLLNEILRGGNWQVGNKFIGISLIEKRLHCKRILIIVDDVFELIRIEIIARRAKEEWEGELDMYNEIPYEEIQKIFGVSYDGLQDTEKDIFLIRVQNTFKA